MRINLLKIVLFRIKFNFEHKTYFSYTYIVFTPS